MANDRLPNDQYPADLGPYPNRSLRCQVCWYAEGEAHSEACVARGPVVYFARLAYEAGFRCGYERQRRAFDAILDKKG